MTDMTIDPARVVLDVGGLVRRQWVVRLPESMVADDLKLPGIWRRVQGHPPKAFQRWDGVFLIGFDESWAVSAVVTDADGSGVTLDGLRVIKGTARSGGGFSDGVYATFWAGSGYGIRRLSDGFTMPGGPYATLVGAERAIERLHPKVAI